MNLNRCQIAGNLTRDPEVRFIPSGAAVGKFGVAINRKWKGQDGAAKEETTFLDVEAWGKMAETIAQYFRKGQPIFIEGRLKTEAWDDKATGQKRSKLLVVAENFQFVGKSEPKADTAKTTEPAAKPDDDPVPF